MNSCTDAITLTHACTASVQGAVSGLTEESFLRIC